LKGDVYHHEGHEEHEVLLRKETKDKRKKIKMLIANCGPKDGKI
jgi:hypothetical protein